MPESNLILDIKGIGQIFIDPAYDYPGAVEYTFDGSPFIILREYDERVLLHECIHAIFAREREARLVLKAAREEHIVRWLTRSLYAMGWRFRQTDRTIAQVECELNEACTERDRLARLLDSELAIEEGGAA